MKNILLRGMVILTATCLCIYACKKDDDESNVKIGTFENGIAVLDTELIETAKTAFKEEYEADFEILEVDSAYLMVGSADGNFLVGEGEASQTDDTGNMVTGHFISRVPVTLSGTDFLLSLPNVSKGESCSGAPCESCAFNPHGGCTCLLNGTCNHTIIRSHDGEEGWDNKGFNRFFQD